MRLRAGTPAVTAALFAVFFLSGLASLVFETLWFRQAGLVFGNTVWATSITTASFMGGLALGSALAARHGGRLARPLRAYAALEAVVAAAGLGLVLAFPHLVEVLAPVFRPFLDRLPALNAMRTGLAFALLLVPATAMGATLPIVTRALSPRHPDFGRLLGRLYGVNTVGAVAGALAGELWLIERLGIRGTGLAAASLDLVAAGAALAVSLREPPQAPEARSPAAGAVPPAARRVLAAAALCGGILLALEVVWFRFLLLFLEATSLIFAVLLAVVLAGIALGGLAGAAWLGRDRGAHRRAASVALLAGAACALSYAAFTGALGAFHRSLMTGSGEVAWFGLRLMLPTCFASGVLFPLLGQSLREHLPSDARAAGWLTLANTVGGLAGALLAGFVLLPRLGVEASLFALAAAYALVAVLAGVGRAAAGAPVRAMRWALLATGGAFVATLALFPHGLMRNHYVPQAVRRWMGADTRIAAVREGLTETVVYLRKDFLGEPLYFRLVTNSVSMASTHVGSQRYMGLFAWWPLALHPRARDALLISYGVGTTASALARSETLETIDVVDTSADVLQMSRLAIPDAHPLDDPRVHAHVEDGRFFLTTAERAYDIITSEPPPPKEVVSLYTREYFTLLKRRLKPGGLATYWLPVAILEPSDFKAIARAFCEAFPDCTLWTGYGPEWMLAGGQGSVVRPSEEEFGRLWRDPRTAPALRRAGLEVPEQLGSLFIADAPALAAWTAGVPPVDDDHPYRLTPHRAQVRAEFYASFASTAENQRRFAQSEAVRALWPEALRERSLAWFSPQAVVNRKGWSSYGAAQVGVADARELLLGTPLRTPVSWMLQSGVAEQEIAARAVARGDDGALAREHLGIAALAARDYAGAERQFAAALAAGGPAPRLQELRALAQEAATTTGTR
jgi:predicted membrane-bound spermidine synthase